MNARTSWSANADPRSDDPGQDAAGESAGVPLDDLLEARFDDEGRLAQIGRGSGQRIAERLDPRPPAMSAAELERAVKKLSLGLEAIERHSGGARLPETRAPHPPAMAAPEAAPRREGRGRDFVTYSLDRLEARLESLSKRLRQRAEAGAADSASFGEPPAAEVAQEQSPARSQGGDTERSALDRDSWERDPTFAAEPQAAAVPPETWQALDGHGREQAAPAWDPPVTRDAEGEQSRQLIAQAVEHPAERARLDAERDPQTAAEVKRHFAALEARIEALQQNSDRNQIDSVRGELVELLREIEVLGREGQSIAAALEKVHARLDQVESKVNAARNMTGNRISELQDRLSGLTDRLGEVEAEVPGFDALRENQSAILERFDRVEGLVGRLASPEELLARVDGLKRQLQTVASPVDVERLGEQIRHLTARLENLPDAIGDQPVLERIERQLQSLAAEFVEGGRQRSSGATRLEAQLADLASRLQDLRQASRPADLSAVERLLSDLAARLDEDRRFSDESLGQLDRRLAAITHAIAKQEDDSSREVLSGLTRKMDSLAEAIGAHDTDGTRRNLETLDRKLDYLAGALSTQAEHLSAPQMSQLEGRLDQMQRRLEEIAERSQDSVAQFGPFAQKLHEISERISSGVGPTLDVGELAARLGAIEERLAGLPTKGPDSRALYTQLEGIVSRLELLKGRSIDPARLTDLLERVDSAIRSGLHQEQLERIEEKLGAGVPVGLPDERFASLEQKIEDIAHRLHTGGGEILDQDDLSDLRADIVALRRELRSLPGLGDGEESLSGLLKSISLRLERLPDDPPATAVELEQQVERIAQLLDDPSQSRAALAQIEASLKTIEARLDDTRRALLYRDLDEAAGEGAEGDIVAVAGLAKALSDDVSVLKNATSASDRKTQDALEAVQDTLEAVVKRMAFLERDAEMAAGGADAREEDRTAQALGAEPGSAPAFLAPAPVLTPAAPAEDIAAKPEPARDAAAGGLFSRFTSSQLMKRATGGRAESFSPDLDEVEEAGDEPLEPGTDGPLNSALTGAPSSDTALMSGARGRGKLVAPAGRGSDLRPAKPATVAAEPAGADDFLAAARRAAKAASLEAVEAEREAEQTRGLGLTRIMGLIKTHRRAVLASVLALAVAFAALQIVRDQMGSDGAEIAARPETAPAQVADTAPPSVTPAAVVAPAEAPREPTPPPAAETALASAPPPPEPPPASPAPEPPPTVGAASAPEPPPAGAGDTLTPAAGAPSPREADAPAPASPPVQTAALSPAVEEPARLAPTPKLRPVPDGMSPAVGPAKLRDAAMAGDPIAAFEVAARYAEGRSAPQDMPAAVAWYRHASEAGLAPAQYRLGSIYEKGLGVEKDPAAAQQWYSRAAEAGNVKAMHNLAVLYAEGAGGAPDLERAAMLFRQAAEHGVRDSQFNLAILHARGLGVPQDMIEAYKWFAIAASSGDAESLKRRDIIAAALNEADLAKAQAAAAAYQPSPLIAEANDVMMPEGGWGEDVTTMQLPTEKDLVALVQMLLAEKGFDPGPADGLLGQQTVQAITKFQEQAGLPKTGQIDTGLLTALQEQSG